MSHNEDPCTIHDLDKVRRAMALDRAAIVRRKETQRASDRRIAAEYRDNRKNRRFGGAAGLYQES